MDWIIEFIERFGYISIFVLITLENVFPPMPSEIILAFGGFIATYSGLTVTGVILSATAGSVSGAIILYNIGKLFGVKRLECLLQRWGLIFGLEAQNMSKTNLWFKKYSYWAVFLCRVVPLMRSLISIPAGMSNMRFSTFLLLTAAGTFIWNTIIVGGGALLGESWEYILMFMEVYHRLVYVFLTLAICALLIYWIINKLKKLNSN